MAKHGDIYYGTEEVAEITGISAYTIRYYDKCGFFPHLERGTRRVRSFREDDVKQLQLIDALRKSGLSIEGIKYYVRISGEESAREECEKILQEQKRMLELQQESLAEAVEHLAQTLEGLQNA